MRRLAWCACAVAVVSAAAWPCRAMDTWRANPRQEAPREDGTRKERILETGRSGPERGTWIPPWLSAAEKADWRDGRPPGWGEGGKTGWDGGRLPPGLMKKGASQPAKGKGKGKGAGKPGGMEEGWEPKGPPGWEQWKRDDRTRWEERLRRTREGIRGSRAVLEKDVEGHHLSLEAAARSGVPMDQVELLGKEAAAGRLDADSSERLSRAMAAGVGRNVDFPALGEFVRKQLDSGVRGDDLAVGVYREMDRRQAGAR